MTDETALILPVGTSTFGWMCSLDENLLLPPHWTDPRRCAEGAPQPDADEWIRKLRAAVSRPRTNAELDSTRRWLAGGVRVGWVDLLVSDTDPGRWVARVLRPLMEEVLPDVREIRSREVPRLAPGTMKEGLRALVHEAATCVRHHGQRGRRVAINGTPGFKAEAALMVLLGAVLGAEVFYLHELMPNAPVRIPPLGLRWEVRDDDLAALRDLADVATMHEAADALRGAADRLWPFVEQAGGMVAVSAIGQLLLEASEDGGTVAELPSRRGEGEVVLSASEGGHRPRAVPQLCREAARDLPFVQRVREVGWRRKARLRPGVRPPQAGDGDLARIRLRLATADEAYPFVELVLETVCATEAQWRTARRVAAARYGAVTVAEEHADLGIGVGDGESDPLTLLSRADDEHRSLADRARQAEEELEGARERESASAQRAAELEATVRRLEEALAAASAAADEADQRAWDAQERLRAMVAAASDRAE